jgi:prevent-host-death family protein
MSINAKQTEVTVAEAKARLSELLRRAELSGERIVVTRRGKPVAQIVPVTKEETQPKEDWVRVAWGLLAEAPEVFEAIDEIFRDRQNHMPRELHFPWDDEA